MAYHMILLWPCSACTHPSTSGSRTMWKQLHWPDTFSVSLVVSRLSHCALCHSWQDDSVSQIQAWFHDTSEPTTRRSGRRSLDFHVRIWSATLQSQGSNAQHRQIGSKYLQTPQPSPPVTCLQCNGSDECWRPLHLSNVTQTGAGRSTASQVVCAPPRHEVEQTRQIRSRSNCRTRMCTVRRRGARVSSPVHICCPSHGSLSAKDGDV